MEFTYIIPPNDIYTNTPIPGVATLLGIMEANNIEVDLIDINRKIANRILTKDGVLEIIKYYENLKVSDKNSEYINVAIENAIKYFNEKKYQIASLKNKVEFCKHILTDSKLYYDLILYRVVFQEILKTYRFFCYPYRKLCSNILSDFYTVNHKRSDHTYSIDIEKIRNAFESDINPTKKIIREVLEKIKSSNTKGVGISINMLEQLYSGMYIAYLLKKETNVHVNIGGSFFEWSYKEISNLKEFFGTYFDTISIGDNTCTCTDLVKYIDGEIEISEVANIIYKENDEIKVNHSDRRIPFKDLPFQSFGNYNKEDYVTSELILPLKASTSCYWGKCIFCECSASDIKYEVKHVEKIVEEIEHLSSKYNTKYFYFWDNSIHPKYAEKLSELLIKKKLKIKYSIYARLEDEFDDKLLKKMKKSGCVLIHWGLDSASERVLEYIKKGISLKTAEKVIRRSYNAGINNFVYFILEHPTQTVEDLEKDVDFIKKMNNKLYHVEVGKELAFFNTSIINKDIDKYKKLITIPQEKIDETANKIKDIIGKERSEYIRTDVLFLYSCKFGHKIQKINKKLYEKKLKYFNKIYKNFLEAEMMNCAQKSK